MSDWKLMAGFLGGLIGALASLIRLSGFGLTLPVPFGSTGPSLFGELALASASFTLISIGFYGVYKIIKRNVYLAAFIVGLTGSIVAVLTLVYFFRQLYAFNLYSWHQEAIFGFPYYLLILNIPCFSLIGFGIASITMRSYTTRSSAPLIAGILSIIASFSLLLPYLLLQPLPWLMNTILFFFIYYFAYVLLFVAFIMLSLIFLDLKELYPT
ncbi:MAG: hypothetical protein QW461_07810 [Candidatus Jordarchaeales archaeon]